MAKAVECLLFDQQQEQQREPQAIEPQTAPPLSSKTTEFKTLPLELRQQIWRKLFPSPQKISINSLVLPLMSPPDIRNRIVPITLGINQESRHETLKLYTTLYRPKEQPVFWCSLLARAFPANTYISKSDTLLFRDDLVWASGVMGFGCHGLRPELVTNLEFDGLSWYALKFHGNMEAAMSNFQNLKQLHFITANNWIFLNHTVMLKAKEAFLGFFERAREKNKSCKIPVIVISWHQSLIEKVVNEGQLDLDFLSRWAYI